MGFDERYRHDRSPDDDLIESLAALHRLELDEAEDVLAAARRAAAADEYRRPIRDWFAMLVGRGMSRPAPGARPRRQGPGRRVRAFGEQVEVAPGRRTLAEEELRRREDRDDALARVAGAESRGEARRDEPTLRAPRPLEASVLGRMGPLFGFDFAEVQVHTESLEATGSTRAIAKDGEIHFRDGAYQPGTSEGDRLIAHELAHVVQQRRPGGRSGARRELEREADVAAALVARGQPAPIAFGAPAGTAYAFDDGEDHGGGDVDEVADDGADAGADGAEHADADAEKKAEGDQEAGAQAADGSPVADGVQVPNSAQAAAQSAEKPEQAEDGDAAQADGDLGDQPEGDDADGDDGADVDPHAELAAAGEPVAAEDAGGAGGGGDGGGGGGAAARPVKDAPAVAGARPETGLGQLRGVRPDKVAGALGDVHAAAGADVDKARAKSQASPPKQMSTGGAVAGAKAAKGAGAAKPGPAAVPAGGKAAAGEHDEKPVKAEVPGGQAAKQAQQGEAKQEQKSAGQVIDTVVQAISSWFGSFTGGKAAEGDADKMSDAEGQQMAGSLDSASTDASGISTDPGPAPELEMKGDARAGADKDRADLEAKTAQLEDQGRADSRVPMGEDSIETSVAAEELTATAPAVAPGEAALPTVAGSASSEEVGIIAQEEHGAEIDAALTRASADVAVERGKHAQEDARARTEADTQVAQLKTQADADQAAAKSAARADVEKARGEWKGEIDRKGADARKQADKKVSEGMVEVEAEQTKANEEARKHVDEARDKAEAEKQKGEKEAADAKAKGKKKSSGFGGWLARKAKSLFDGIKKAISSAIDAARKAVKAVIDAAKKLAMAAIELARKAIVAVIKAIGKALIAISNVLLAAFPELKARFQKAINGLVDKAVKAVNKLAEGLKKAVQKALDLLGAVLDKALQLLEKGLHAIVDAANAVVQAAIKAAEAIAATLGTWIKLIKDVAKGPGSWIGKLGSAVVDGIKNHLWGAFKSAVVEWFKSKVMELLGVGGILLSILLEGGINTDDIVKMAMDALIVAIPIALVAILIEKLVAMIVPAAGAVMAIIEGLQAAWGTVSRIIAAFGAFMAFLQAVQGGAAGPLFATALASAAIVLLDFVANWLLRKLAGPARKVGARLKGMGDKMRRRGKGKGGKGKPRAHAKPSKKKDGPDGPHAKGKPGSSKAAPKKTADDKKPKDKDKKKKEETLAEKEARLHKAVDEVKRLTKGGKGIGLLLRARLWGIKRKYKLTELSAKKQPGKAHVYDVKAAINPQAQFEIVGLRDDANALGAYISSRFSSEVGDKDLPIHAIRQSVDRWFRAYFNGQPKGYELHWIKLDDRDVVMLKNSKSDPNPVPVGAIVHMAPFVEVGAAFGRSVFMRDVAGKDTEYVKDADNQYVPRKIIRNITEVDLRNLKRFGAILPRNDPDYLSEDLPPKNRTTARTPRDHAVGGVLSPFSSATKDPSGDVANADGEPFLGPAGRATVDLAQVRQNDIFDLSTKRGQDTWGFSFPDPNKDMAVQALRDVVRTSEVLIRGRIPKSAVAIA